MTALAGRALPRHTVYFRKTTTLSKGRGFDWEVTDEHTGLVVRSGWVAGTRRDAQAEARMAVAELGGEK